MSARSGPTQGRPWRNPQPRSNRRAGADRRSLSGRCAGAVRWLTGPLIDGAHALVHSWAIASLESVVISHSQPMPQPDIQPDSVVDRMRQRTAQLHREAERAGMVAALLRGQATQSGYTCLLRNLLPAYQAMEETLSRGLHPLLRELGQPALYRSAAIEADLRQLHGSDWTASIPLLPAARRYADRVRHAAQGDGALMIAHCYTRYLGDLNGGRIIARRLADLFGPSGAALAFARFDGIPVLSEFVEHYRLALDQAGRRLRDTDRVVEEAAVAFQLNIDLSHEAAAAMAQHVGTD